MIGKGCRRGAVSIMNVRHKSSRNPRNQINSVSIKKPRAKERRGFLRDLTHGVG